LATVFVAAASTAINAAQPAWTNAPQVYFDAAAIVPCRDATTPEFARQNPSERLVAAAFEVSSLIRSGSEQQLLQYFYTVLSPEPVLHIVDYAPKTTLASDLAGNVTIEHRTEDSNRALLAVSAPSAWPIKVNGNGELGSKTQDLVKYELTRPMIAVAASGTLQRGGGVYFKLKPSRSASLEGAKEFSLVFRVPQAWRGGYVHLTCKALGVERGLVPALSETVACGEQRFLIALYADGDTAARSAAERLVRAQTELLKTAAANRAQVEKQPSGSLLKRFTSLLENDPERVPADWPERLVFGAPPEARATLARRLPDSVRHALTEFAVAKRQLHGLGAGPRAQVQ
jgi:hypothetical protein